MDFENISLENRTIVEPEERDNLYVVIPMTVVYSLIFLTGLIGNVSTCVVIARNKSMHTATNYYLFSLAISDLLLLLSGLPPEIYRLWWPQIYIFGETFCNIQSFSAETSANATVLTITAFTVERYIAICHPFLTHTMSKLSRAIKFVIVIWLVALCLAIPQAIQYGVLYAVDKNGEEVSRCTMTWTIMEYAFEVSTLLFFVGPMTVITVLYVLIGLKLRHSREMTVVHRSSFNDDNNHRTSTHNRNAAAQNRVIKMLVAVVVAFFVCWAPFHAQRLLAVYITSVYQDLPPASLLTVYLVLNYTSGILYFMSTTVNPLLYNIMSNKFREAFKSTLAQLCDGGNSQSRHRTYSTLSRCAPSLKHYHRSVSDGVQSMQVYDAKQLEQSGREAPLVHLHSSLRNASKNGRLKKPPFRTRGSSESSQVTVITSISPSSKELHSTEQQDSHTWVLSRRNRGMSLGLLAERFRNSIFRSGDKSNGKSSSPQKNVDHISNSSLQDMDGAEFSNSDLVKYMAEINHDLT